MKKLLLPLALLLATGASAQEQRPTTASSEVEYNQYGVAVKIDPLKVEAQDGFLVFRSKDTKYKLWLDCRVQADFAAFYGEDKDYDPIGNGASIRRARFAVKAQITKNWYGEVDMDMANGVFELKDAIIRYDGIRNTEIQIGNFKEFFSLQRNNTSRYLQFMERPMATQALAPSRHIGANIKWARKWMWLSGGVFFQTIDALETRTYVEDNNKDYGRNEGMSYTGKAVFMPGWNSPDWGLHLGAAVSYRQPKTDVDPKQYGMSRFSTRNSTSINRKKYLDTNTIPNIDYDLLYTAELAGYWKGLRFETAVLANDTHIKSDAPETVDKRTKHFWGWYAQAGYLLFGGKQRYDSNGAKFTRIQRGRNWGDLELCFRYDYLTLNSKNIEGGSGEAFTVGLNYYINNHVKVMLNYQYNNNDRYANGKGKLFVGHDETGAPTKDPMKVVEGKNRAGVDYHMLAARIEINF